MQDTQTSHVVKQKERRNVSKDAPNKQIHANLCSVVQSQTGEEDYKDICLSRHPISDKSHIFSFRQKVMPTTAEAFLVEDF